MPRPRARIARTVYQPPPRHRDGDSKAYLDWVRKLPDIISGQAPSDEAHHLLRVYEEDGRKLLKGMGRKQEDRWALPLRSWFHDALHDAGDDEALLAEIGFDARALCNRLWLLWNHAVDRDPEARRAIDHARSGARLKVGAAEWDAKVQELYRKFGGGQ